MRPAEVGAKVEPGEKGEDGEDEGQGPEEVDPAQLGEPTVVGRERKVEHKVDGEPSDDAEWSLQYKRP